MYIHVLTDPTNSSSSGVSPTAQASQPKSSSSPSVEQAASHNGSNNNIDSAHLIVIKWKDDQNKTQRFRLIDRIKDKWHDIGDLLRIPMDELSSLADKQKDPVKCCRTVLDKWMKAPPAEYPVTWKGTTRRCWSE